MASGKPEDAISALRTALAYAPGERSYELLLAQSLADAAHVDEAFNYFSGLWDAEPGNGFINLELARLAARRSDPSQAVNFYRASIYGTWEGDGAARRRAVRLELAEYLLAHSRPSAARAELLITEGNADADPALDTLLGGLLERAGDRSDALDAYMKAIEAEPRNVAALTAAGRLAFSMGQFATARSLLERGERAGKGPSRNRSTEVDTANLLSRSTRILELIPSRKLPSEERVQRLLELKAIARKRLDSCAAMGKSVEMAEVEALWSSNVKTTSRAALLRDQSSQDELLQLIYRTESMADGPCGPVTGDDALIVLLSRDPSAGKSE